MLETLAALVPGFCYIGSMPEQPDNAVAIYPTSGYNRDLTGSYVREPTFQIKVRHTVYPTGYTQCLDIQDALHGQHNLDNILLIAQEGDIMPLGRDETGLRNEWTMNFRCYFRR